MTGPSPRARRLCRAAVVACAALLAILLAPVLIAKLFVGAQEHR